MSDDLIKRSDVKAQLDSLLLTVYDRDEDYYNQGILAALEAVSEQPTVKADRIKDLERENARLDAGWHDANKEILRVALIAKEAEAKLEKAVEALRFYAPQTVGGITFLGGDDAGKRAAAALAELEGKE